MEEIGDSAFSGCKSLESIYIPRTVMTIGKGGFSRCNNLSDIEISKDNSIFSIKNDCIINNNTKTLIYAMNKALSIQMMLNVLLRMHFMGVKLIV